jgi:hypothetical protein
MKRRKFIKKTALAGVASLLVPIGNFPLNAGSGELLYNGIQLPIVWPPDNIDPNSYTPMVVPYLLSPPKIIPIDVGRQLFVDDFLIEKTTLTREYHNPRKIDNNPIFKPETNLEQGPYGIPGASPKDGGIWWDPLEKIFKMWYEAGWLYTMAYATSQDGIHWKRPDLNFEPGTNRLVPDLTPDSTTVFLDHFTNNPDERFKMFLRPPDTIPGKDKTYNRAYIMVSPDGIRWSNPVETGICGDRSTMFYNPFRGKWIYSIRSTGELGKSTIGRARYYREHSDFMQGGRWKNNEVVFWTGADNLDLPDPVIGEKAQLYNLSAVGYESLILGLHQIHLGPPNEDCLKNATPKITELKISFSRDGFHWYRPNREAFISATRKPGTWDRGYVQSVGGICNIVGDKLWFHYIGFKGDPTKLSDTYVMNGMHSFGSTGIAVLRRDGFASMNAGSTGGLLTTRLITFNGRYLFVNIDCPQGELRVEILDKDNSVIIPFTADKCTSLKSDSTIHQIKWKDSEDLSSLKRKKVKFRFYLENGKLYSFWLSPEKTGASHGYNAAGGPGFNGGIDVEGIEAYQMAVSFPQL